MKKFLSLVLALVMTMSLVTVAGAKDFTDDADIDYEAAIDVMTEIGVIDGYADGTVRPDVKLNRGQAAKIICNLLLGPTDAAALPTTVAPFSDVAAGSTFAGYIAYCAQQGIINGYTDGTFKPGNTLTGFAFMKMLLGALGYDAKVEGYAGNNWAVAVAKQAMAIGLDDGLEATFNGNLQVSRQEAMLYCFNMLQATMVEYDNKSSIQVGDITITTDSEAKSVWVGQKDVKDTLGSGVEGTDGKHTLQFAEKHFSSLKAVPTQDYNGRPITEWYKSKTLIATEKDEMDYISSTTYTFGDLYADIEVADGYRFYLYEDGEYKGYVAADKGNKDKVFNMTTEGRVSEFYIDCVYGGSAGVLVLLNPEIVEIEEVDEDEDGVFVETSNGYEYYTEDFKEGDMVLVHYGDTDLNAGEDVITYMTKVEKKTGKLTKMVGATNEYTIDGVVYTGSDSYHRDLEVVNAGDTVDFYLDENGFILTLELAKSSLTVNDVALVLEDDNARGPWAKLVFADGTKKIVDTDKVRTYGFEHGSAQLVSFEIDGSTYELTDEVGYYKSSNTYYFDNGTSMLYTSSDARRTKVDAAKVDAKTTFVLLNTADDYATSVYVGIDEAPTFSDARILGYDTADNNDVLDLVYVLVDFENVTFKSDSIIFTLGADYDVTVEDKVGTYYTVKAIVDGKLTTLNVKKTSNFDQDGVSYYNEASFAPSNSVVQAWKALNYNSKKLVISGTQADREVTLALNAPIVEMVNGVIELNGKTYSAAKDCNVYVVDADYEDMKTIDVSNILTDDGTYGKNHYTWVTFTTNLDGKLDNIVLVKA